MRADFFTVQVIASLLLMIASVFGSVAPLKSYSTLRTFMVEDMDLSAPLNHWSLSQIALLLLWAPFAARAALVFLSFLPIGMTRSRMFLRTCELSNSQRHPTH